MWRYNVRPAILVAAAWAPAACQHARSTCNMQGMHLVSQNRRSVSAPGPRLSRQTEKQADLSLAQDVHSASARGLCRCCVHSV